MAKFKDKMRNRNVMGNKIMNSNEALGLVYEKSKNNFININLDALVDNPFQPRKTYNEDSLDELANNIKENGLLQPIVISPIENQKNKFYIAVGHRRVRSTKKLKHQTILADLQHLTNEQLRIYALIENIQRENVLLLDEVFAIREIINSGIEQKELTNKLGKSKSYVSKLIKISTLSDDVVEYINENKLPQKLTILYALSDLKKEIQLKIFKDILKNGFTRDQSLEYIKNFKLNKIEINKKVSPRNKVGFSIKKNKNNNSISLNIDLEKITKDEKDQAINELETLLENLKSIK